MRRNGLARRVEIGRRLARVVLVVPLVVAPCATGAERSLAQDPCRNLDRQAERFRTARIDVREGGEQQARLRAWGGPLHRLMCEIGGCVAKKRLTDREVARLLGEPDEVVAGGKRHATVRVPVGERHWIYRWRGGHDYLYFVIRDRRVASSRWWLAGE